MGTKAKSDRQSSTLREIGMLMVAGVKDEGLLNRIADLVQKTCRYRWVGIYKICRKEFAVVGISGATKPAYPRFPVTQGISAEVYETGKSLIVKDVSKDARFLPNFWTTKSEIVVPIVDDEHNLVTGIINVESAEINAFDKSDRDFLEGVGQLIWRALR